MNRMNGYIDSFAPQAGYRQHGGIWSGISAGNTYVQASGLLALSGINFRLELFGGSGYLTYRGGPYEGLHIKEAWGDPANSGPYGTSEFPIPHSGHVVDMISMDSAYKRGRNLILMETGQVSAEGAAAITFVAGNRRFTVATQGSRFPFNMSGILSYPTAVVSHELGDMAVFGHSNTSPGAQNYPSSQEEATARSLGPGTLTLNTGSGLVNISTGSGIAMYCGGFERVQTPLTIQGRQRVPMQTVLIPDTLMAPDGVFSGVRFFVPGLYLVDYTIGLEKATGTNGRTMAAWGILVQRGAEGQFPVPITPPVPVSGSISYGTVNNTTALANNSLSNRFLVNVNTGDFLALEVGTTRNIGAGQDVVILGSGTRCIIQYLGPKRSETQTRGVFGGI